MITPLFMIIALFVVFMVGTYVGHWYWLDRIKALSRVGVAISTTEVLVVNPDGQPVRFPHDGSRVSIDMALSMCMRAIGAGWR